MALVEYSVPKYLESLLKTEIKLGFFSPSINEYVKVLSKSANTYKFQHQSLFILEIILFILILSLYISSSIIFFYYIIN